MDNENYTEEFDPYSYQAEFFPGMADFVDANIIAGDKIEEDRLIASYWNDLGDDVFDDWGYFYLYDVDTGKYYFPLINPQNQADGDFTTQIFNAFGRVFTIIQGWAVQGIFKFDITVNDNRPFRFGMYGNMGSDGDEDITNLTYSYGTGNTLYYQYHAEEGDEEEILYSYWIPKKLSQNSSITYDFYNNNDDNSMMSKQITNGLLVYFAKKNDVKEWVVNDLRISSYSLLNKSGGDPLSYETITTNSSTGEISTTSSTIPGTYTFTIRNTGSYNITTFNLTVTSAGPIPCLTEDTIILTPFGYKNVKELNKNDYVLTSDNRRVRIVNIYKTIVAGKTETYPYIIPRNSITANYPRIDTRLSGGHLIYYNNRWIHPRFCKMFNQDRNEKVIKYYHVELENYSRDHLVINNGLIVESFTGLNNPQNRMIYRERINKYNNKLRINAMRMNNKI
jgi:hypothetical protein